ncbi:Isoprenylcysteine carboxyl methyltransferase family-domain-containing protein [Scheffersomyces xylosifermentans]|uniref:Isoprenylcysteine carboxyl methyltransferase family-domain-containing protein n=1 Tax=Scheffersomyces xylosifermentans TaxID=1304137 RepID=UPI00315C929E
MSDSDSEDFPYARYDPNKVNLLKVALKSVFLGVVLSVNSFVLVANNENSGRLNWYFIFLAIFHLLEFVNTVLFNNSQVDDDSFILEDKEMHVVTVMAIAEYIIRVHYFGITAWPAASNVGLIVVLVGQFCRSGAMYTASESFNHYIQRNQQEHHKLITHGIYSYLRHPSYFGFFWWFVGLQLFLNNAVVGVVGSVVLWRFFSARIEFEEKFLVQFFKTQYVDYKDKTGTGIPFIR